MTFEGKNFGEIPETEELKEIETEEERETIERMENLSLGNQDKMNLILTFLGEKPTSEVEIDYDSKIPFIELEDALAKKENLEKNLSDFGLKFKILERERIDKDGFEHKNFQFLIGKDEEKIKQLEGAILDEDVKKQGILFGYPGTAAEAFSKGIKELFIHEDWWQTLSEKEKGDISKEGILNFKNFQFSKKHWREELEFVRRWQGVIKEKAPKLFQEITKDKPWVMMTEEERNEWEEKAAEEELKKIRERVDKMADALGKPIDEGIKEIVTFLNAFDMRTSGSCEGHFNEKGEKIKYFDGEKVTEETLKEPRAKPPWVDIESRLMEIKKWREDEKIKERVKKQNLFYQKRMIDLLEIFYKKRNVPFDQRLHLSGIGFSGAFRLENQGAGVLELEKKKEKLARYQEEIRNFTKFLRKNYQNYLFRRLRI